ncbi:hypothetical protein MUY14_39135 [Amycolatopsis sp. FBCC-B4732]|nr:hypothetical protein MUY14_39135 [Amycolatopsis sp. FBCC-B4732]
MDAEAKRLLAEAAAPGAPRATVVTDGRKIAVKQLAAAGPISRSRAEAVLGGSDDDVVEYITGGLTAAAYQDDRARVGHLAQSENTALAQAALAALGGTDVQVNEFLKTQPYEGKEHDERTAIAQLLAAGGPATKEAAQAALNGSAADRRAFLRTGQFSAAKKDDRIAVAQALATGGAEVKAAAQITLAGPDDELREFLQVGKAQAQRRDQDTAAHVAVVERYVAEAAASAASARESASWAAAAAATARHAADEAAGYAEQARRSATEAGTYADQAKVSAASAQASAEQAALSAKQARQAAATAQQAAARAADSAAKAAHSAAVARSMAQWAASEAEDARKAAADAGKSASEAADAAAEAVEIFLRTHNNEQLNGPPQRFRAAQFENGVMVLFTDGTCLVNGLVLPFADYGLSACEAIGRNFDAWITEHADEYDSADAVGDEFSDLLLREYCNNGGSCSAALKNQLKSLTGFLLVKKENGIGKPFGRWFERMLKLRAAGVVAGKALISGRSAGALADWTSKAFQVGAEQARLNKDYIKHILERHHPRYWDGSFKATQTFFDSRMTIPDIEDAIRQVLTQNQAKIIANGGTNANTAIEGVVNGVTYKGTVAGGKIVQFFPK